MGVGMDGRFHQDAAVEAVSLQDETILFQAELNQFYILNHTASVIWSRLAQPATREELVAEITEQFAGAADGGVLHDVDEALGQMMAQRLIAPV